MQFAYASMNRIMQVLDTTTPLQENDALVDDFQAADDANLPIFTCTTAFSQASCKSCHSMQEIDALVDEFKAADDANFTLFTYAAELGAEVAALEERARAAEAEIGAAAAADAARESGRLGRQQEARLRRCVCRLHSCLSMSSR
jgi:hypothetical protein